MAAGRNLQEVVSLGGLALPRIYVVLIIVFTSLMFGLPLLCWAGEIRPHLPAQLIFLVIFLHIS